MVLQGVDSYDTMYITGGWWQMNWGGRLIIMAGAESVEWYQIHQKHGFYVFYSIHSVPAIIMSRPPLSCLHIVHILFLHHMYWYVLWDIDIMAYILYLLWDVDIVLTHSMFCVCLGYSVWPAVSGGALREELFPGVSVSQRGDVCILQRTVSVQSRLHRRTVRQAGPGQTKLSHAKLWHDRLFFLDFLIYYFISHCKKVKVK